LLGCERGGDVARFGLDYSAFSRYFNCLAGRRQSCL
jgi:hypothetical protein